MFLTRKQIHTRYTARYTAADWSGLSTVNWSAQLVCLRSDPDGLQVAHGRMAHRTADELVYCHEAMHLQLRLQNAGWSADVQRWESDEDSEDSEGECEEDEKRLGSSVRHRSCG